MKFLNFVAEMENLQKILKGALALFMRYGIKSVTMDDVARELGISKKTLYQHVDDKNDLVKKSMSFFLDNQKDECCRMVGEARNPIDFLLRIGEFFLSTMRSYNPAIIYDVKKYYPACWELVDKHNNEFIFHSVLENLKKGIELGYFRPEMNPEIVTRLYISMVQSMLDINLFPPSEYHLTDIHRELLNYHIRGVSTPAGIAYLSSHAHMAA